MPQILFYIKRKKIDLNLCLFAIPAGLFGFVSKFLTKTPYISIVDGADIPNIQSDMSRFVVILKPLFKAINAYSDAVILLDGLDDIALPLIKNKNIHSLACGLDMPDKSAQPCKKNDGILHLLSIGRLTSRKGFNHIVEACRIAKLSNDKFHLKIIGYGKEEANLARAINEHNLQDNITLVGRVEYDQLPEYYMDSDCYIFFGDREGQSLALMDAVAYGLPVICSNHPGVTSFVKDGKNGISVNHPNVEQLAGAFLEMMENYSNLPIMGRKSRLIAESNSWRNVAISYKSIINKVLGAEQ
jgi:glycosyltransferase involved in cell wall biosynthesis